MLCRSSLDNSSLRAGLCHLWFHKDPMTSKGLLLPWIIIQTFPFLPSQRQLHGSLPVWLPWDTLQTCLPPDHDSKVWVLWSPLALLSISIEWWESVFCTFLPILLWVYVWHFHLWAISLQIPSSPYPSLTFSQSMDYTAPRSTVRVCLTGFCISQLWSYITWLLHSTVAWVYMGKVPTKDLQVVYLQFVSQHRAILNLLNGHGFMHIAVIYGRISATTQWWESCYLNQQVTLYSWNGIFILKIISKYLPVG